MTRLERFLAYSESHRFILCAVSAVLIVLIAWADWLSPDSSTGILYLIPVLLTAAALNGFQILIMAAVCGYLREVFDPLQGTGGFTGWQLVETFNPARWIAGSFGRLSVSVAGFAMTGFFVSALNERRRLLAKHLAEQEEQIRLRREAELQVRTLIETSPLAILTIDHAARVALANESARQLLGFDKEPLQGEKIAPYLPTLSRMLHGHHAGEFRTNVECKGQRRNGEVFLAHVWLSTYRISEGPRLAAVVWDASENLRDREGSGLDSMMATSRVLIGAISHEIRNLAAAARTAHGALAAIAGVAHEEHYRVLGRLIEALEKIASSGLREASDRAAMVADLSTVLDETRIVIEPALRDAGVRLVWEVPGGLPLVQADHHSLLQAFINLTRNSLQALEPGGSGEVRISAAVERDLVVVRVRDTGPGVAHPEELFQPFQPGAHSFGLGLYISRAILRSHGGGLRYEAEPAGSCFAVDLWPVENAIEE